MQEFKLWKKYYRKNQYYHELIYRHLNQIIEKDASVVEFGARGGEILRKLKQKRKLGINLGNSFPKKHRGIRILNIEDIANLKEKFDYIIINNTLAEIADIQSFLNTIKRISHPDSVFVVLSFNYLWKPITDIAETVGLKYPYPKNPNWLDEKDIVNFFSLENYVSVSTSNFILIPFNVPLLSKFTNKYIAPLPLINKLCLTKSAIFKNKRRTKKYTTSVVIPARNEEGNIKNVLRRIPTLGKSTEVIFVEGNSHDATYKAIENEVNSFKSKKNKALYFKQQGKGKGDAVRLGFKKSTGEILMILDADLTVDPKELVKFYNAIANGSGDFIMGSRFVYPMENQAMRTLNHIGNKIFSHLFSYLLDQTVKDTLCGTKVLFRHDYQKIEQGRNFFGDFDPFGDFDLIFGAKKLNLKILEIPVRYKDRTYGKTNISRFTHGWLLLKMSLVAAKKFKFNL